MCLVRRLRTMIRPLRCLIVLVRLVILVRFIVLIWRRRSALLWCPRNLRMRRMVVELSVHPVHTLSTDGGPVSAFDVTLSTDGGRRGEKLAGGHGHRFSIDPPSQDFVTHK